MAEPVVLINAFEVPAADAVAFIAAWCGARDYLRSQPGYIDTVLHQSRTPDAEFQFVNVAHWQTAKSSSPQRKAPASASQPQALPATGRTPAYTGVCAPETAADDPETGPARRRSRPVFRMITC